MKSKSDKRVGGLVLILLKVFLAREVRVRMRKLFVGKKQ